uniref:NADH-ubiquinone oxidoreductase chain 5 n=1 Tax=Micronecta sahlbergii TaxID=2304347 RepID=A0A346LZK5_9HEMI|nr:NADH dehydrogenase subunit 5 [Micronecta sahlbergii]AXQ02200.1 NADH dehydrogenase subunit 5 [Micronecta sahlbergii]
MLNLNYYYFSSLFLFILGSSFWFLGLWMIFMNTMFLIDWEILMINSCSIVFTLLLDYISMIFMGCVLYISSMVILYSKSYMSADMYNVRFLFLVLMFVLSMLFMIISPNLISILLGWDGLGLVSYCLVIYFQNYKSYSSGMLTILTNRIGDVAILMSIAWMLNFGSWNFIYYLYYKDSWVFMLFMILILAGFTKSAQIPFSSWLPAAMAAPTPVSALVHSSTLVTAGVYLMIRFSDLYLSFNCQFLVFLGLITMFMSGLGANYEYDLKKIIALSTLSQLGLMMSILFLGFPVLAFFHLLTHAFFKALLFLCAGLIIHCMNDSQDIRHMGGVSNFLPFTSTCFVISSLSLCGAPFLSGFYSKDMILEMYSMNGFNMFIYFVFFISVGLTVSYSFRLVYYCISYYSNFYVCQSYDEDKIMNMSMVILTALSILGGSVLGWLIFPPTLIILPLEMKLLTLLVILSGSVLGYEFSGDFINNFLYFPMMMYFFGSMWFMPSLSTYLLYKPFFQYSNMSYKLMDMGWGELLISKYNLNWLIFITKINQLLHYNNLKIIMFTFFFLFFLILI